MIMRALQFVGEAFVFLIAVAAAVTMLSIVGAAIEGIGDWQVEHERCLKRATNGYEAARCR